MKGYQGERPKIAIPVYFNKPPKQKSKLILAFLKLNETKKTNN
jgi:hypothetical protein